MSTRITSTMLRARVAMLNRLLGLSDVAYQTIDGRNVASVGTYVLSGAYGGWSVACISNESGGERHALGMYGHAPARECLAHLNAAIWMAQELKERQS